MAFDPLSAVFGLGDTLIKRLWPDPAEQDRAKLAMMEMAQSGELQELAARAGIVQAEAQSEHWLTATWRPMVMLAFAAIVVNNYLLYPYLRLFWSEAPVLELPEAVWHLLTIGIGGYTVGRSVEKMVAAWKTPT